MRKVFARAMILSVLVVLFGACASFAAAKVTTLGFAAATTSTWVYGFSVALSEVINPKLENVKIYPEATAGSSAHYAMLDQGIVEIATGSTFADSQAVKGEGNFTKKYDMIRSVMPINKTACQIVVAADSGIEKMQDLEGKRVAIGGRGSPTSVMAESVLTSLGINADLSISTHEEMVEMFKDKRVEAIVYFGGSPYSGILDIASGQAIRLIPMAASEQDKILDANPSLSRGVVKSAAYSFLTDDVPTLCSMSNILAHKDVDGDLIYEIVKSAFENWSDIVATVPAAASVSTEDAANLVLPLHPGALKFYEEKGISIPEKLKP